MPTTKDGKKKQSQSDTDPMHWCGHRVSEHTGEEGMCKFNRDGDPNSCECGGLGEGE